MKDERARAARSARRAARAIRKEERARARAHRHASIRGAMDSHRAFMDELSTHGQKLTRVQHPLAAVLRANKAPATMRSAVSDFFQALMARAIDELDGSE